MQTFSPCFCKVLSGTSARSMISTEMTLQWSQRNSAPNGISRDGSLGPPPHEGHRRATILCSSIGVPREVDRNAERLTRRRESNHPSPAPSKLNRKMTLNEV